MISTTINKQKLKQSFLRQLQTGWLLACFAIAMPLKAANFGAETKMLNGIWVIEATPPENTVTIDDWYLPSGTRIKLEVEGPTRRAIEEEIPNLLGGTLTVLPPFPKDFCKVRRPNNAFYEELCPDGKLTTANTPVEFDVEWEFNRATKAELASGYSFYAEHGAKAGAKIALMFIRFGPSWQLWLQKPNVMVSECPVTLPGDSNFESFPMIWRKQAK